ncbi:MAG: ABC transporter permease [Coriobacteriales bacterium]|jgi:peptide/nickel transport system permease protein|nr:ABC transporter permease [Coriobacteriales bacterium]
MTERPNSFALDNRAELHGADTYTRVFAINKRTRTLILLAFFCFLIAAVMIAGFVMDPQAYGPNYDLKRQMPSLNHLFGTDYLGRDMLARTIKGLSLSMTIGLVASLVSAGIAVVLGIASATLGGITDRFVNWAVDLAMGIPHLVLMILISFMMGRGLTGVVVAVAITHWPSLTRVIRAEVLQLRGEPYVKVAQALGHGSLWIGARHILPHVLPQFLVGLILLFPHAILHEAALTFLGFGLPFDQPAIGSILSEAMKHLSTGMWWLAFFPGLSLLIVVLLFKALGENLALLTNPHSFHT